MVEGERPNDVRMFQDPEGKQNRYRKTHWCSGHIGGNPVKGSGWRMKDKSIKLKFRMVEQGDIIGDGVIAPTEEKDDRGDPIFAGTCQLDGEEYVMKGYIRTSGRTGEKFMVMKFRNVKHPEEAEPDMETQREETAPEDDCPF